MLLVLFGQINIENLVPMKPCVRKSIDVWKTGCWGWEVELILNSALEWPTAKRPANIWQRNLIVALGIASELSGRNIFLRVLL
jgi:hypothetical protein